NSPISFTGFPAVVNQFGTGDENIGISPQNCEVVVLPTEGINLFISNAAAPPGNTVCVDVSVANFNEITSMQFSMTWDFAKLNFLEVTNLNLPEATLNFSFGYTSTGDGILNVSWMPIQGYSLADETVIFQLCFAVLGDPEECGAIIISDFPLPIEITNENSNGNNIGMNSQSGEVCVLNPEGIVMVASQEAGDPGEDVCVDFVVSNFTNVLNMQYSINWDPTVAQFDTVLLSGLLTGLEAANFDMSQANIGIVTVTWVNDDPITLPDSSLLFELCYTLVGEPTDCSPIFFTDNPLPIVVVVDTDSGEENIGLINEDGEICINDILVVVDTIITPESCPGTGDGAIDINILGGTEPYFFRWDSDITPPIFSEDLDNLNAGTYTLELQDFSIPPLLLELTVEVPLSAEAPIADAGDDMEFGCEAAQLVLSGADSSTGDAISYQWSTTNGTISTPDNEITITVTSPGTYYLEVSDTESGCASVDSVLVAESEILVANAGEDGVLTCAQDTITLSSGGSSLGTNIQYSWEVLDGGHIVEGEEMALSPHVYAAGIYILEVKDTSSLCSATDTVIVTSNIDLPLADAGEDAQLGCGENQSIVLDGSGSSTGPVFIYKWFNADGELLTTADTVRVNEIGFYTFLVTNTINGCSASDEVEVYPSDDFPQVSIDMDNVMLNCAETVLTLSTSVVAQDGYTFEWIVTDGGHILEGEENILTPQVDAAGTYTLVVNNPDSNCPGSASVALEENFENPEIIVPGNLEISCNQPTAELNGTGSSTGGNIIYQWTTFTGGTIENANSIIASVNAIGWYYLEVLNTTNGCLLIDSVEVIGSADLPVITIAIPDTLDCQITQIELNAEGTTSGAGVNFTWSVIGEEGNIVAGENTLHPIIDEPGIYAILVEDTDNGCSLEESVSVLGNYDFPIAEAGPDQTIDCLNLQAALNGTGSTVQDGIKYKWINIDTGNLPFDATSLMPVALEEGDFELTVINQNNGCSATDTVSVIDNSTVVLADAGTDTAINCEITTAILGGSGSTSGDSIQYKWEALTGVTPDPFNTPQTMTTVPGLYQLVVTNTINGCTDIDQILVADEIELPVANAGSDKVINCIQDVALLNGTGSSTNGNFVYQWTTVAGGGTLLDATTLMPTATVEGTYELLVTNNDNGCSNRDSVFVVLDLESPIVVIEDAQIISCLHAFDTLDATATIIDFSSAIEWSTSDGNFVSNENSLTPVVDSDGTYQLLIRNNTNGCADSTSIVVQKDITPPLADAGLDRELPCDDSAIELNGSTSSGDEFLWSTESGNILSGETTEMPTINAAGNYQLIVTNSSNGCTDTAFVQVIALEMTSANAGADLSVCDEEVELSANLPSATSGKWEAIGIIPAMVVTADSNVTMVMDMSYGENLFVWSLSTAECPNYSADTVTIFKEGLPIALNDVENITLDQQSALINLLANDDLSGASQYSVSVSQDPLVGSVELSSDGIAEYFVRTITVEEDEFTYSICNLSCPDMCDTALVKLLLEVDPEAVDSIMNFLPNAITPNNDGTNDELVFDVLMENPDYPDNEIIIFNRWGDIVYEAKPYLNDWKGTNTAGKELPHGTYYYILRLDVSEGVILRGDVTILK
ncbi:MAG: T9SS type B sorting domain-containing protein, partial [Bacteroidetes bacterium]|nr:T9SS type B sorting domain-containing protein [Bacteroidota bacterium]